MSRKISLILVCLLLFNTSLYAEVISSEPDHFVLKHEATSSLSPKAFWARLIQPQKWWSPDHTYSGDSNNLALDARAGGFWQETWKGGSVIHGTVLFVKNGEQIRLDAPFGPLQSLAVKVVWTITIIPEGTGTRVVFDEVVNGSSNSQLKPLAEAVDFVKSEAINRLVSD